MAALAARLDLPYELCTHMSTCVLCASGRAPQVARDSVELLLRLTHLACTRCAHLLASTLTSKSR